MTMIMFHFLYPVIHFLGTLCLIGLLAAGVLAVIFWLVKVLWKPVLCISSCIVAFILAVLFLGSVL